MAKILLLSAKVSIFLLFAVKYGYGNEIPCCHPGVYTVGYSALVSEAFDDGPLIYTWDMDSASNRGGQMDGSVLTISYDNGTIETTRQIANWKEGTLWVINGLNCVKLPLDGEMSDGCLPEDAIYEGSDKAAFSEIPLEVGTWSWWDSEDNGNYLIGNLSVTRLLYDCRPVQELFFGKSKYDGKYYDSVVSGTFKNYVYGIMNPDKYFTVPQYCPKEFSSDKPARVNSPRHRAFSPQHLLHKDFIHLSY